MSSQSLYRKWRPQTFTALKGQDAIRDTLFYALTHDQASQAYLFCGPRGTGKTTTARLIAKLVNCTAESGDKPCNTCLSCTSITEGTNLDIFELDAASNRGIDEIRQLRDTVRFAPTIVKYKVFIIDEVHMLTREAFNALLKTLEEPPAYVLFILATTESHKIPPTIISRCQRYDFRLIDRETIAGHLQSVAKEEGIKLAPDAAQFIARLAQGSFRDSLSLLEQVAASGQKEYSQKVVEELFGYVPREQVEECLGAILTANTAQARMVIDAVVAQGSDLRAFCDQLLALSQEAMEGAALGQFDGFSPHLAQAAKSAGLSNLVTWLEMLLVTTNQMKQSPIVRLPLDLAVAKFSLNRGSNQAPAPVPIPAPTPVMAKKEAPQPTTVAQSAPVAVEPAKTEVAPDPLPEVPLTETVSVPVAVVVPDALSADEWSQVLNELKEEAPSLVTSLAHAKLLGRESDVLKVAVRFKMHADMINQPTKRQKIETIMEKVVGVPLKIEAQVVKEELPDQEEIVDIASVFDLEDE